MCCVLCTVFPQANELVHGAHLCGPEADVLGMCCAQLHVVPHQLERLAHAARKNGVRAQLVYSPLILRAETGSRGEPARVHTHAQGPLKSISSSFAAECLHRTCLTSA